MSKEAVKRQLAEIGERRKRLNVETAQLARDTEKAVQRAKSAHITVTEAARLLGLERSYLYRGYGA